MAKNQMLDKCKKDLSTKINQLVEESIDSLISEVQAAILGNLQGSLVTSAVKTAPKPASKPATAKAPSGKKRGRPKKSAAAPVPPNGQDTAAPAAVAPVKAVKKATAIKNIKPCIAEGCNKPSKGPRFKFLCEDHLSASTEQVEAWKAAQPA